MKAFPTILIVLLLSACGTPAADRKPAPPAAKKPTELELPVIPSTLITPEARVGYALYHFWDKMDFSDRSLSLDTTFMEQNFANFAELLQYADSATAADAINAMMTRAEQVPEARSFAAEIVEKYLDDPESPMRNEETFIHFLRRDIASAVLSDAEKERARGLLGMALKNRQGSIAADFRLITSEGEKTSLHSLVNRHSGRTILLFYDPDCENCAAVIGQLAGTKLPPDVLVVAVDPGNDRNLWEAAAGKLPQYWKTCFALTPETDGELYVIRAMPTLYLLDGSGRVILKDPSLTGLMRYFEEHP